VLSIHNPKVLLEPNTFVAAVATILAVGTSRMLSRHHIPPLSSLELLEQQGSQPLDYLSRWMLRGISVLDHYGAGTWDLYTVGLSTFVVLGCIRLTMGHWRGVNWYALVHALVSTAASFICLYLDYYASAQLTGIQEPLRSVLGHAALTSLHRITPAITMGYSFFDIWDGIFLSVDFLFHGIITLTVMAVFVTLGVPQMLSGFIFMELSTPFLNLMRADFFSPTAAALNQAGFVLAFFLGRLLVVPPFWALLVYHMWDHRGDADYNFPRWFLPFSFIFGMFFNVLNVYWFYKIIKKAMRRLKGAENHTENNELSSESSKAVQSKKDK
jgi:TLC domain